MNWASSKAGAMLVDFSTELEGCPASNVLDDDLSTIWLSEEGFPQWLCISLANFKHVENLVIRTIGWNCWHSYITNPRIVSMHVSSDGSKFKMWDSFEVPHLTRGTQLFSCAPVDPSMYPFIALEVTQTFGGAQTYMNRVFLYSDEVTASPTSSKDGQSTLSGIESDSSLPNIHSNNVSDLSARTPEKEQPRRVSHDTEQLVDQLQQALGLGTALDDSYYSDDQVGDTHYSANMAAEEASPATVAGRLASLEHTVHALEHTLLEHHSRPSGAAVQGATPNVSFARSPSHLPSHLSAHLSRTRSRSRSPTTSTSLSSDRHRHRDGTNREHLHTLEAVDVCRVALVTDRLNSIEEKFTRLLDTLEKTPIAQLDESDRYPPHPPPPPPPLPLSPPLQSLSFVSNPQKTHSPTPSASRSHSVLSRSQTSPTPSTRQPPQHQNHNALSGKNATITSADSAHAQFPSRFRSPSSSPLRTGVEEVDGTERVMEQVVRSVETMMRRVLAQHEHKHQTKHQQRVSSMDSTINSSSVFDASSDGVPRDFLRQKKERFASGPSPSLRPRSRKESGPASRCRPDHHPHGSSSLLRTTEESSDDDKEATRGDKQIGKSWRGGLSSYVSRKAERLLQEKKAREREERESQDRVREDEDEEKVASFRRRRGAAVSPTPTSHIPHSRVRAAMQERPHVQIRRESPPSNHIDSDSDSGSSDDVASSANRGGRLEGRKRKGRALDQESHSVLERSIFELLKSKYGLGVSAGASQDITSSVSTPAAALPMRVPIQPTMLDGAVVDWPQYVKNRVASSSGASSRQSSPLRQGVYSVAGVLVNGADNGDVLPRARQHSRDSRREREHQQAVARDRSLSPLRQGPHVAAMKGATSLVQSALFGQADVASAFALPAWCEQDVQMAALVRALHEKVYQRTVKEAQYDMLLSAQR